MSEQSKGSTLKANIALLENNARVAAEIAVTLVSQEKGSGGKPLNGE
jgi:pseudouridine-5'-phosphate glycosidase